MKRSLALSLLLLLSFSTASFAAERGDLLKQQRQLEQEIVYKQGELAGIQNMFKLYFDNLQSRLEAISRRLAEIDVEEKKQK